MPLGNFSSTSRSAADANAAGSTPSTKAMVRAQRCLSSAKLASTSGIAGASIAYELAADRSVLLVEAEPELARHSTARSAATYVPGHGPAFWRLLASYPRLERARGFLDGLAHAEGLPLEVDGDVDPVDGGSAEPEGVASE